MNNFTKSIKRIALVVVALMVATSLLGIFAACSQEQSSNGDKITFWGWGSPAEVKVYEQLIAQYQDENPGVTIAYTHYESNTYMNKFMSERTKPDVFFMPDTDFIPWADAGTMLELDSYVTKAELDSVWTEAMNEYYYNPDTHIVGKSNGAKLYGFPKDLGPIALVYNKTLLDQQISRNNLNKDEVYALLNPTKAMTWAEFRQLLKDLTADQDKNSANQIYGIPYYEMDVALYSNNANYFSNDASTQALDEHFIESLAYNIQLATVDKVMPSSALSGATDAYTRFFNNKTIFTWMGPWDNADFWAYDNLVYDVIPVPYNGENPEAKSVTMVGSMCYGVSAKSKNKEAAVKFAKWLSMGKTCQESAMKLGQQVPNLIEMASSYISTDWNVQPANRSLFIDIMDGNTNSINLYDDSNSDQISGKTRSLYYTYDSTWKDNLMSYIDTKGLWESSDYDMIKKAIEDYRSSMQADLDEMNSRWKG